MEIVTPPSDKIQIITSPRNSKAPIQHKILTNLYVNLYHEDPKRYEFGKWITFLKSEKESSFEIYPIDKGCSTLGELIDKLEEDHLQHRSTTSFFEWGKGVMYMFDLNEEFKREKDR